MLTRLALVSIDGYRRYISPRKGWSCAYRVRRGEASCSDYARERVRTVGLLAALPSIRARFRLCAEEARGSAKDPSATKSTEPDRDTPSATCVKRCGGDALVVSPGDCLRPSSCGQIAKTEIGSCGCIPDGCGF